jgi:hypothetical protein
VPVYWFAGYTYGPSATFSLAPNPEQGGYFASNDVPAFLDPITGFGRLGFGTPGHAACSQIAACCSPDETCALTTRDECAAPAVWNGSILSCAPNPCLVTAVPERPAASRTVMVRVSPNPFVSTTAIDVEISECTEARLEIFDSSGRLVRRILSGTVPAGRRVHNWDGLNERGVRIAAGVYYVRLAAAGAIRTLPVLRLR